MNNTASIELIPRGIDPLQEAERSFWTDIKWRTLHCLIETSGCCSISDLARKAGMRIDETVQALEAMEVLKFIKKTSQGYEQLQPYVKRNSVGQQAAQEKLADYFIVSHQITNQILEAETQENVFTKRVLYTSSAEVIQELMNDMDKAIENFKQKSEQVKAQWDGVYAISVALTPMTKEV